MTGTDKPTLRQVTARSLIGATYAASDATYTMEFPGWPFAWRTAKTWGCLAGTIDSMPDAVARGCIDEGNPSDKQRINIMIRACPTTCTAAEQTTMTAQWLDEENKAKAGPDGRTWYVETQTNASGYYTFDVSMFIAAQPGKTQGLKYQVGMSGQSPPQYKDEILKALNDVYSQVQ